MPRLRARSQHVRGASDGDWRTDFLRNTPANTADHDLPPSRADQVSQVSRVDGRTRSAAPTPSAGSSRKAAVSGDLVLYCRIRQQVIGAWRRREPAEVLRLCARADRVGRRLRLALGVGTHLRAVDECRRWAVAEVSRRAATVGRRRPAPRSPGLVRAQPARALR